jgi:transglutaminase-like putative cysteine protease
MKTKLLFTALFTLFGVFFLGFNASQPVSAAILNKQYSRTYELREGHVVVTESVTMQLTQNNYLIPAGSDETFTVFNPILDDEGAQTKIDQALPTLQVDDGSGSPANFTTEVDGQNLLVKVKRKQNQIYGQVVTMSIMYQSYALSSRNGAIVDLYVPSFAADFPFNDQNTERAYTTIVRIPKSFGEVNLVVPEKTAADGGDFWEFQFAQQELTGVISWLQVGMTQFYEFNIVQPYAATTNVPAFFNSYRVILPRDVSAGPVTQKVYFQEVSPAPQRTFVDDLGNLVAEFVIPADRSGDIVIKGFATVSENKSINIKDAGTLGNIDIEVSTPNTAAGQYWEVDAEQVQDVAKQLKAEVGSDDVYALMEHTYEYVVAKIDYSTVKRFGLNVRQGALATLNGKAAVCMEYSDLFIALLRAQGVPARAAFGYGYDSRSTNGVDTAHQWAEVYIPNLDSWIGVDTTWGENGPAIIGGDLNHLYRHVAATDPNTPAQVEVTYFGGSPDLDNEEFHISTLASIDNIDSYTTQSALLEQYPNKEADQSLVVRGALYFVNTMDNSFTQTLQNIGIEGTINTILRLIIYTAPLWIVTAVIAVRRIRTMRRKKIKLSQPT